LAARATADVNSRSPWPRIALVRRRPTAPVTPAMQTVKGRCGDFGPEAMTTLLLRPAGAPPDSQQGGIQPRALLIGLDIGTLRDSRVEGRTGDWRSDARLDRNFTGPDRVMPVFGYLVGGGIVAYFRDRLVDRHLEEHDLLHLGRRGRNHQGAAAR